VAREVRSNGVSLRGITTNPFISDKLIVVTMASLRRSGVRLSSLGKSNGDLKMVISQLKTVRENYVAYTKAQEKAMDDMTKWAFKEDNRAIQDALERFNDIYVHWFEAQREFADCFDDFRQNFKMILEGEQGVESAKSDYEACEHREHKLAKDLKKLSKKAGNCPKDPPTETVLQLRDLQHKLDQASKDKALFKREANDRIKEQEAVKMIRFKAAFNRLTAGHLDLADKCDICFVAGKEVTEHLPDIDDTDIHKVRYTGAGAALRATIRAKERIKNFRSRAATNRLSTPTRDPLTSVSFNTSDRTGGGHDISGNRLEASDSSAPPTAPERASTAAGASGNSILREAALGGGVSKHGRDKEDLPPAYNEVTPARNPYFQPTPSSYTPGGGGGDSHRVRPEGATSGHDALDSSSPSGCYMLNNLSNLSFQSYPNSPAGGRLSTDTASTVTSSADNSFIR